MPRHRPIGKSDFVASARQKLEFDAPVRKQAPLGIGGARSSISSRDSHLRDVAHPSYVEWLAVKTKEWVQAIFHFLWTRKWEPPAAAQEKKISREIFETMENLRNPERADWLLTNLPQFFEGEQLSQIYAAMGKGDPKEGEKLFKKEPLCLFLYCLDVDWDARNRGYVDKILDRLFPKRSKTQPTEQPWVKFLRDFGHTKKTLDLLEKIFEARKTFSAAQMRAAFINDADEDYSQLYVAIGSSILSLKKMKGQPRVIGQQAFERDPFCTLLYLAPELAEHHMVKIGGKSLLSSTPLA